MIIHTNHFTILVYLHGLLLVEISIPPFNIIFYSMTILFTMVTIRHSAIFCYNFDQYLSLLSFLTILYLTINHTN